MDRNFYNNNDDFEEFLKQKADQYKLYPSDRVWNNIYSSLHGRRKWLVLGFTLFFIISSLFIGKQAVLSNYNRMATQLNKGPEMPASTKPAAHNLRQYTLAGHTQPADKNNTVTTALPVAKNYTAQTIHTPLTRVHTDNNKVALTAAEGQPLVIENDLLPAAVPGIPAGRSTMAILPNTNRPVAGVKQPGAGKSIAATTLLKENNINNPVAKNDIAAITPVKPSRLFLQLYVSPIISYRRLSNQNPPDYNLPVSASYAGNINKYVHHEPAPGLEAGAKILFKLSNSLSLYAGAQLNYSRYYIDAYKYHVEKASIALKNDSQKPDTLSGYTTIRNFSGYKPEQLQNQYLQLSIPVGLEIKLLGDKKLQLNVAGGVQPTFVINSNSYLISSDYKNYIQSPDLARSFNVHTNFEAFISYQTGGIKWQLGPQFRSQLLSSYSNQYRVREYLTEFGIKFGITKSLR